MSNRLGMELLSKVAGSIDVPESSYATAYKRYEDIGEWFGRPEARCSSYRPRIYPQGSFRLGTVVRPITEDGDYDLDVGCRLEAGISTETHSQYSLKEMVGADVEEYRKARRIQQKAEEKRRCWRLRYADELKFHIDAVPSIPSTPVRRGQLREAMVRAGTDRALAATVAGYAGAITDTAHPQYRSLTPDWRVSNSEGFAIWFEAKMKLAPGLLLEKAVSQGRARIEDLPTYRWKSPLQASVQVLKRHRDIMFAKNPDSAPISVILTTLAGLAYQGEQDLLTALFAIASRIPGLVSTSKPRVPNPVNPDEDFADKWYDPAYSGLRLEEHFRQWSGLLIEDLKAFWISGDRNGLSERMEKNFGVARVERPKGGLLTEAASVGNLSFPDKPVVPKKPGGFAA